MASDDSPADFFRRLPRTPPAAGPHDAGGPKRYGIPPSYPHFPPSSVPAPTPAVAMAATAAVAMTATGGSRHARSLSQPAFFSFDALPPLSPTPYREPASSSLSDPITGPDVAMDDSAGSAPSFADRCSAGPGGSGGGGRPPRKTHRRSTSDVSFSFSGDEQALLFGGGGGGGGGSAFVKREGVWTGDGDRGSESEMAGDDLFSAFMNFDFINSTDSGFLEKSLAAENRDDLDSRASGSGTKANREESSENEVESSMEASDCSLEKKGSQKRSFGAVGAPRHSRSVSVDSFMGGLPNFADESLRLPPSPGVISGQHSRSNSLDGSSNPFGFEQGSGDFSGAEMKKIMANEKLAEIAVSDPKRAKRILANRQSAARSKERKMRYISELENKLQTLQTEATTLSAQLTILQRDSAGLNSQNNELRFRLQSMEQQARLRDALNEALTSEVRHLKLAAQEITPNANNRMSQQLHVNPQLYQMHQQPMQTPYQLQQQQHRQPIQQQPQPQQHREQKMQQPQERSPQHPESPATMQEKDK